jgi:hypothetical protein
MKRTFSASEREVLRDGLTLARHHYETMRLRLRPRDPLQSDYKAKVKLAQYLQRYFDDMFPDAEDEERRRLQNVTPLAGARKRS